MSASRPTITRHDAAGGVRIYRIPMRVFPELTAYAHVVIAGDYAALLDAGSGIGESDRHLAEGFAALRDSFGERLGWGDLRRIVVTHAHIDHYGGLAGVRARTDAPIAVHVLDRRVLTHHAERLAIASQAVAAFMQRAGVPPEQHRELLALYGWSKELFQSVQVADVLEDGDTLDGLMRVYHAPGHCPGQVCLQVEDVLLTADHVLPRTTPFIAPESITPSTGAAHYLEALRSVGRAPGVRLALGGHEEPIEDLAAAIARTVESQRQRVERVQQACAEPRTVAEVAAELYPEVRGYDRLLALQRVGAYVEYLDQRGELAVANLDVVAADPQAAPRYRAVA